MRPSSFLPVLLMVLSVAGVARASEASALDLESRVVALEQLLARTQSELADVRRELAARDAAPASPAVDDLARQVDALSRELEDRRLGAAAGEPDESAEGHVPAGVAPGASGVYRRDSGVSMGGYGEMLIEAPDATRDDGSPSGRTDRADLLRAVLYFGHRFNDRVLFSSELEVEHANTEEGGEVAIEQALLDFTVNDHLGVRAGLVLTPLGFINEVHEPTTFLGATRPLLERVIIPSTWRENAVGLYGDAGPVSWRAYLMTGLEAEGFTADEGLREGRQAGAKATAEDLAVSARLDWTVRPGLALGFGAYVGDSGQGLETPGGDDVDARVTLFEGHVEWKGAGWDVRALWARADVDDADLVNEALGLTGMESVGSILEGWYAQVGYDVLSHLGTSQQLLPFVRYSQVDTQADVPGGWLRDPANDREILTLGLTWRPLPQVAVKLDWQDVDDAAGTGTDQWNLALGYSF